MTFTVDGVEWPVKCKIVRKVELRESEISGIMMDFSYNNDCIGKWMGYDLAIVCPFGMEDLYNQLHSILSDPVDGHQFVMPDGAGTLTVTARVLSLKDTLYEGENGNYWAGLEVSIAANHPTAVYSLGELLTRGHAAMPDLDDGTEGDTWTYTNFQWVRGHYNSADDVYY